ncbi:MAG: MFS transporter [Pseudonocardiales bacterium]|nr:MFS transporter [Pseudonocardiales bacterium]
MLTTKEPVQSCDAIELNPHRWRALPFLLVGPFLSLFDQFVVNVAASPIGRDLMASPPQLEAIVSGYGLVYALGLVTGGRLGDAYGRKRMYRVGLLMFTVTSALCGLALSPTELVAARLLQGASGAVLLPQVLALIRIQFPDGERARALAAFGVSIGIGQIGGQVLGGAIPYWNVFGLAWRPIFYINVPVCLVAWVCCGLWAQESRPNGLTRLDLLGSLLSVGGVGMMLVPLIGGHRTSWWPTGTVSVAAGMLLLVIFLSRQRKLSMDDDGQPLVPTWLFRTRGFTIGVLLNMALYLATIPFFFLLGIYLQSHLGESELAAGLTFTPTGVGFIVASRIGPRLYARLGLWAVLLGTALTAVGLALTLGIALANGGTMTWPLPLALLLFGLGIGTTLPLVTGTVLRHLPAEQSGAGAGVLAAAQQISGAVGVALCGALLFTGAELGPGGGSSPYVLPLAAQLLMAILTLACAFWLRHVTSGDRPLR